MVDRHARDKAAQLVRHFISGRVDNFTFEQSQPHSNDAVIAAIWQSLWCYYDDFTRHRLRESWALSAADKSKMARWLLFLYSDEEYRWPAIAFPGLQPLDYGWLRRLCGAQRRQRRFLQAGTVEYWPFIDGASYHQAQSNPRLLANV